MLAADLLHTLLPNPQALQVGAQEGRSVATGSLYHVTSKPNPSSVSPGRRGLVEIYDAVTNDHVTTITPPITGGNSFGSSVAVSGSTVVVGANKSGGSGRVFIYEVNAGSATLTDTITSSTPGFTNFGGSVAISGSTVIVGASSEDAAANNDGRVYVYDISGASAVLTDTINNPTPEDSDQFGSSVDVSGATVVVGATLDDTSALNGGSVYVYQVSGGIAALVDSISSSIPHEGIGTAAAISGSTVVVGAPSGTSVNIGRAYVYDVSGGPAALLHAIDNPTPGAFDNFARSVDVSGSTVVLGASTDDTDATNGGIAYVYDVSNSASATLVDTINNPTPEDGDSFGRSVSISGSTVLVGAPLDDTSGSDNGSAYAYDIGGGTAVLLDEISHPTPGVPNYFGNAVATSGSLAAVGAYRTNNAGTNEAGSVYVYDVSGENPTLITEIQNPTPENDDHFGRSIAMSGSTLVVGAYSDNEAGINAGSVYVYDVSGTSATLLHSINNPDPAVGDWFGWSVDVSGSTVVVGATLENTGDSDAGSVYVYDISDGSSTLIDTINNPTPGTFDNFGYSVAVSGSSVVAGERPTYGNTSRVYIYDVNATSATLVHEISNPGNGVGFFGASLDVSDSMLVAAAAQGTGNGGFYVYEFSGEDATFIERIANPNPDPLDFFGQSIAVSDSYVVVGAHLDDAVAIDAGAAYVYALTSEPTTVGGDLSGSTDEETPISGALTISGGPSDITFLSTNGLPGNWGLFSIGSDGSWLYEPDPVAQTLSGGQIVSDTFTVATTRPGGASCTDCPSVDVTITVTGVNDPAIVTGDTAIDIFLDDLPSTGTHVVTGTISVSDIDDGEAAFVAKDVSIGVFALFELDATGGWTYTIDIDAARVFVPSNAQLTVPATTASTVDGTSFLLGPFGFTGITVGTIVGELNPSTDEDTAISDALSISGGEADVVFDVTTATGDWGTFSIAGDGSWSYQPLAVAQTLPEEEIVSDTFTITTSLQDGSLCQSCPSVDLTVTVAGLNDAAIFGAMSRTMDEDTDTAGGLITFSDVDSGEDLPTDTYDGAYGTLTIGEEFWLYDLDNTLANALNAGDTVLDSVQVTSDDGTIGFIDVTITGLNDVATISGDLTGSTDEDATAPTTGTALVTDPDDGEAEFDAITLAGTYGSLTLAADGSWSYVVDNEAAQVLNDGDVFVDAFTIESLDGTTATLEVSVAGSDDASSNIQLVDGVLIITGTDNNDDISVVCTDDQVIVTADTFPGASFNKNDVTSIVVNALDGDDDVTLNNSVLVSATIDGGDGNDDLRGGRGDDIIIGGLGDDTMRGRRGSDIILGGDGEDTLRGGNGRDVLFAGDDIDTIFGGNGDDIMLGGLTIYDNDVDSLRLVRDAWTTSRSYNRRQRDIRNGVGPVLRGTGVRLAFGDTVFSDGDADSTNGGGGQDWLI